MDHTGPERSTAPRSALAIGSGGYAWPLPFRDARGTVDAELERATLDVLAATARAWGLAVRASATHQPR